jgi:hypothetical protein
MAMYASRHACWHAVDTTRHCGVGTSPLPNDLGAAGAGSGVGTDLNGASSRANRHYHPLAARRGWSQPDDSRHPNAGTSPLRFARLGRRRGRATVALASCLGRRAGCGAMLSALIITLLRV